MSEMPFMALEKGFSKQEVMLWACEWVLTGAVSLGWKRDKTPAWLHARKKKKLALNGSVTFLWACVCVVGRVVQTREWLSVKTPR